MILLIILVLDSALKLAISYQKAGIEPVVFGSKRLSEILELLQAVSERFFNFLRVNTPFGIPI